MEALTIIGWSIFGIGVYKVFSSAILYLRDRSGNSGRTDHWQSNPRIDGPDDGQD